ncbi:MAG TPA: hypothetical protein VK358_17955, partial [Longimicrobium sp.]|nr:hypothetical protein [Longimicrobium sp.]
MELLSVPFAINSPTRAQDGLLFMRGVLCTEADGLVLEYNAVENYFNKPTVDSGIRTLRISWSEVQSLVYRRRFWGLGPSELVLRTRSLRALEGVPAANGNQLTVQIPRADRLTARELAASVELALAEH